MKHLKHFLTEFLIVVAGILVALAVDQWRQDREELRILNDSLTDVAQEIRVNISTVERIQTVALDRKMKSLATVIAFLSDPKAQVEDPVALLKTFASSANGAVPWLVNDRFEALRNSGNLRLLRDSTIASELMSAYQGPQVLYSQVEHMQGAWPSVVNELMPATMQTQFNSLHWYMRDASAPTVADPGDATSAIAAIRERRAELLRLARTEAAVATGKWYALERNNRDLHKALKLLARWDPQASNAPTARTTT